MALDPAADPPLAYRTQAAIEKTVEEQTHLSALRAAFLETDACVYAAVPNIRLLGPGPLVPVVRKTLEETASTSTYNMLHQHALILAKYNVAEYLYERMVRLLHKKYPLVPGASDSVGVNLWKDQFAQKDMSRVVESLTRVYKPQKQYPYVCAQCFRDVTVGADHEEQSVSDLKRLYGESNHPPAAWIQRGIDAFLDAFRGNTLKQMPHIGSLIRREDARELFVTYARERICILLCGRANAEQPLDHEHVDFLFDQVGADRGQRWRCCFLHPDQMCDKGEWLDSALRTLYLVSGKRPPY
jgi:hypothetical protein